MTSRLKIFDFGKTSKFFLDNYFDLIVVGAGSGGLAAAKRAAMHGALVAIIEGDRVGGTCVIRGCVPKKLLLYGALYQEHIANALSFGVEINKPKLDSSILLENVRTEVDRLNSLHIKLLKKNGIKLFKGWAEFVNSNSILIRTSDNKDQSLRISGKNILLAIGGEPNRPDIPGAELAWVSDDIFLLDKLPEKIVVVGAGFIACEFSCILHGLGVDVIELVRGETLLRGFDEEISNTLLEEMRIKGIKINFGHYPVSINGTPGDLVLNQTKMK